MPDTDADKQTGGGTGTPPEGSAPQNKNNPGSGGSDASPQQQKSDDQKSIDRAFFNVREKGRKESESKDSQIAEMQAQINELKTVPRQQQHDEENSNVDLQKELERFKGKLMQEFEGREIATRIAREEHSADEWLSSRQYISEDDAFADAVASLIHSKYNEIAKINPLVAAKQAYNDVCQLKGVVDSAPDFSSARASGTPGSSGSVSSKSSAMSADQAKAILTSTDWNNPKERAEANRLIAEAKKAGK